MTDDEQITAETYGIEAEHIADDDQWWQIVADIVEDLLEREFSGSMVLLLLFVIYLPKMFAILKWWLGK